MLTYSCRGMASALYSVRQPITTPEGIIAAFLIGEYPYSQAYENMCILYKRALTMSEFTSLYETYYDILFFTQKTDALLCKNIKDN